MLPCTSRQAIVLQAKKAKVNERGKVSSRPGPVSPKESRRREADAGTLQLEPQEAAPPTPLSSTSPATSSTTSTTQSSPSTKAPLPAYTGQQPIQETPQVVVDRMFSRILACAGVPVFTGMALFPLFYYLKVVQHVDYPLWLVLVAQSLTFGGGLAGISYGVLSSSWDPSREGSFWGWAEFQTNLAIVMSKRN